MDALDVKSLLQDHGLQVNFIASQPPVDLYNHVYWTTQTIFDSYCFLPHCDPTAHGAEQPLVAQMFSGPLCELKTQYEALSYVWGCGEKPKHITIIFLTPQSRALMFKCLITENLYRALHDLRPNGRLRLLWIDAVIVAELTLEEIQIEDKGNNEPWQISTFT